jgi:hypothetical protein
MNQMDSLEEAVRDALVRMCGPDPRAPEPPGWDWHGEPIRTVGEVAQQAGYLWLPDRGANLPAWLWDGVALEQGSSQVMGSGDLIGIALALEVDWGGFGAVLYDFKKLMVARATHRVIVSGISVNRSGAERCAERLKDAVRRFQRGQSGDRYLLACWYGARHTLGEFYFDLYMASLNTNNHPPHHNFRVTWQNIKKMFWRNVKRPRPGHLSFGTYINPRHFVAICRRLHFATGGL